MHLIEEEEEEERVGDREGEEGEVLAEGVCEDGEVARLSPEDGPLGAKEVERHLDGDDGHREQGERERLRVPEAHALELRLLDLIDTVHILREVVGERSEHFGGAEPRRALKPRAVLPQLLLAREGPVVRVLLREVERVSARRVGEGLVDERAQHGLIATHLLEGGRESMGDRGRSREILAAHLLEGAFEEKAEQQPGHHDDEEVAHLCSIAMSGDERR